VFQGQTTRPSGSYPRLCHLGTKRKQNETVFQNAVTFSKWIPTAVNFARAFTLGEMVTAGCPQYGVDQKLRNYHQQTQQWVSAILLGHRWFPRKQSDIKERGSQTFLELGIFVICFLTHDFCWCQSTTKEPQPAPSPIGCRPPGRRVARPEMIQKSDRKWSRAPSREHRGTGNVGP